MNVRRATLFVLPGLLVLPLVGTQQAAAADSIVSVGKSATASSTEGGGYQAGLAVDANGTTRWASAAGSDPQWVKIDLGSSHNISRVKLKWEAAYGKSYKIQTSNDGTTWTNIFSTTTGDGATDDLTALSGSGRYIRMHGTQRGTPYGYSLWEFEVYGSPVSGSGAGLAAPDKKEIAMQLVSSAENSSLNWTAQYKYIEDIHDGRGYTAGIIGFCSGTGDMLDLVEHYSDLKPGNVLEKYLPALEAVNGTDSTAGLGSQFVTDWKTAATDPLFRQAQDHERDRVYFNPAVNQAKADGLPTLGQFMYYDAIVVHGDGSNPEDPFLAWNFWVIRDRAMQNAQLPSQGGDVEEYLRAWIDARIWAMQQEAEHEDVSRITTAQSWFLDAGNLTLETPLYWEVYGREFEILE